MTTNVLVTFYSTYHITVVLANRTLGGWDKAGPKGHMVVCLPTMEV
jgi:hypothetical protein